MPTTNKTFSIKNGLDVANTIILDSSRNLSNIVTANANTANISTIVTGNALTISTGTGSNANIIFSSNGSEDMRITNTGNVGIGTTNPTSTLHVVGNANIARMAVGAIAQSAQYSIRTANGIETQSNSTSSGFGLSIIDAGNNNRYLRFQANVAGGNYLGTTSNDALILYSSGTQNTGALTIGPWTVNEFRYRQNASSNSHSFYGWVGVHTDTPNSNLTVVGNVWVTTGINAATVNATTANVSAFARLNVVTANITTIETGNTLTLQTGTGSNGNIELTANGVVASRITNNAIIFMRRGDTSQNLMYTSTSGGQYLDFNTDAINPKDVVFNANTSNNWYGSPATRLGNFEFRSHGNNILTIANNGVGIWLPAGGTKPNSNLTVVGNVWVTTGINAATVNATTINTATLVTRDGINVSAASLNAYGQANAAYAKANAPITVKEIYAGNNGVVNTYTNINTIQFDSDSGMAVVNAAANTVTIQLNSTFKNWYVNGSPQLVASGLDTVNFIPGTGISITADNNASPKSITFSANGTGGTGTGNPGSTRDIFSGTGACTTFTLSVTPTSEAHTLVFVDSVLQGNPDYNISSNRCGNS